MINEEKKYLWRTNPKRVKKIVRKDLVDEDEDYSGQYMILKLGKQVKDGCHIYYAVADENGDRMVIYQSIAFTTSLVIMGVMSDIFVGKKYIIVYNPYYKEFPDGYFGLKLSDLECVVLFNNFEEVKSYILSLQIGKNNVEGNNYIENLLFGGEHCKKLKQEGDDFMNKKEYENAIQKYKEALEKETDFEAKKKYL